MDRLRSAGYENLACETTDSSVVVWCENRRIRYPVVWMIEALSVAASAAPDDVMVHVVAERLAIPVTGLSARAGDIRAWLNGSVGTEEFRRSIRVEFAGSERPPERHSSSLRKVDLAIGPGRILSEFGLPGVWIRANFDVSAEISTAFLQG